jgi:hypothetical protein
VGRGESDESAPDVNPSENWEHFAFGVNESLYSSVGDLVNDPETTSNASMYNLSADLARGIHHS